MRNRILIGFAILLGLLASQASWGQAANSANDRHPDAISATDVTNAELQTALQKIPSTAVSDQALRVVSINGEYNVAVGIVRRNKTTGSNPGGAIEHSQVTEVYHVLKGTGTLVTGGTLENPKPAAADSEVVKVLVGPSSLGDKVQGGVSRQIGPGDVVVIPPNTPHWFSEVTSDQIVYLVVRVDPKKLLPAGFKPN
ncbi:MAG TPA: cupin domain-containing protein [Candidatus Acidoferrales bacterium]|nr:cupin domain-containing protein [Candidatus Acidoferrales bacterium]